MKVVTWQRPGNFEQLHKWFWDYWSVSTPAETSPVSHLAARAIQMWTVAKSITVLGFTCRWAFSRHTDDPVFALLKAVRLGTRYDPIKLTREERRVLTAFTIFKAYMSGRSARDYYANWRNPRYPPPEDPFIKLTPDDKVSYARHQLTVLGQQRDMLDEKIKEWLEIAKPESGTNEPGTNVDQK